ncbi:MAG TPA: hypothetical protein VIM11_05645 [Tepidisphaeraceae bacterium]|jgi:hypothetical protein
MSLLRAVNGFGTCRFVDVLVEELTFDPSILRLGVWDPGEIDIDVLAAEDKGDSIDVDLVVSCCPVQGAGCCAGGPDVDQVKRMRLLIDKSLGVAACLELGGA